MLSWLRHCRGLRGKDNVDSWSRTMLSSFEARVTLVLGNMACDLDSGVSSLVLAFHRASSSHKERSVVPVMNIPRQDWPLKTELVAALDEEGVTEELLVFRDDLDLNRIPDLQLILVDHNVLSDDDRHHEDKVVEIIDHHVKESRCENSIIETVGSCSSLVLRQIWKEKPDFMDETCLRLVHATILVDTVVLNPEAKKVTPLDIENVEKCEELLGSKKNRDEIYKHLDDAKRRVVHLNTKQLLRRDFKTFFSKKYGKICLSSVPMLAKEWMAWDANVVRNVKSFSKEEGFSAVIILGSSFKEGYKPERDIILANIQPRPDLYQDLTCALESSRDPPLQLERISEMEKNPDNFIWYKQGNIGASRKQIMPIVKNALTL